MKCPYCKKEIIESEIKDLNALPFCSKKCKLLDLGAWASEKYVISSPITDATEQEELLNEKISKENEE